jgi:hypothetical protein
MKLQIQSPIKITIAILVKDRPVYNNIIDYITNYISFKGINIRFACERVHLSMYRPQICIIYKGHLSIKDDDLYHCMEYIKSNKVQYVELTGINDDKPEDFVGHISRMLAIL